MESVGLEQRGLEKGTVIHVNGVPFALAENGIIEGHPSNFSTAFDTTDKTAKED